jgi:hypothetical protein
MATLLLGGHPVVGHDHSELVAAADAPPAAGVVLAVVR